MDATSEAQPLANGSAAAADGAADDGAAAVPAAAAPADGAGAEAAAAPADDQQQSAGLEPVPELAAQLFAQVAVSVMFQIVKQSTDQQQAGLELVSQACAQ